MLDKPRLRVVDDDQIELIHAATAQVLEKTGIREETLKKMTHHPTPLSAATARELDDMARHWK